MFWNKIPKGYVETVDGYIVKKNECKRIKMATDDLRGETVGYYQWYKKENAPKYDVCVTINGVLHVDIHFTKQKLE